MNCQDRLYRNIPPQSLARRWFLKECGVGLGAIALGQLAGAPPAQAAASRTTDPLAPKRPHFRPRAKNVIFLFMAGAPSHLELFDNKPQLAKFDGTLPPPELLKGYRAAFIEHANEVNNRMPAYVVDRVAEALNDAGKPLRGSRILAIGVAYKPGVDDRRESPALAVIERLARKGADLTFHDPFVEEIPTAVGPMRSVDLEDAAVGEQDCVLILTHHPGIDWRALASAAPLLFDTRGVTAGFDAPNVVRL